MQLPLHSSERHKYFANGRLRGLCAPESSYRMNLRSNSNFFHPPLSAMRAASPVSLLYCCFFFFLLRDGGRIQRSTISIDSIKGKGTMYRVLIEYSRFPRRLRIHNKVSFYMRLYCFSHTLYKDLGCMSVRIRLMGSQTF